MSTNKYNSDDKLLLKINQQLDDSIETLDAGTLSKLNQARHHALEQPSSRHFNWMLPAALASILIISSLWMINYPTHTQQQAGIASYDEYDEMELINDIEFISWLADQDDAG